MLREVDCELLTRELLDIHSEVAFGHGPEDLFHIKSNSEALALALETFVGKIKGYAKERVVSQLLTTCKGTLARSLDCDITPV